MATFRYNFRSTFRYKNPRERLSNLIRSGPAFDKLLVPNAKQPKLRTLLSARAQAKIPFQFAFTESLLRTYQKYGEDHFNLSPAQRTALERLLGRPVPEIPTRSKPI